MYFAWVCNSVRLPALFKIQEVICMPLDGDPLVDFVSKRDMAKNMPRAFEKAGIF